MMRKFKALNLLFLILMSLTLSCKSWRSGNMYTSHGRDSRDLVMLGDSTLVRYRYDYNMNTVVYNAGKWRVISDGIIELTPLRNAPLELDVQTFNDDNLKKGEFKIDFNLDMIDYWYTRNAIIFLDSVCYNLDLSTDTSFTINGNGKFEHVQVIILDLLFAQSNVINMNGQKNHVLVNYEPSSDIHMINRTYLLDSINCKSIDDISYPSYRISKVPNKLIGPFRTRFHKIRHCEKKLWRNEILHYKTHLKNSLH